uniref:Putative MFS-type transporter YfcJ n=1 Tax=Candidatus Methanophaga sp. ANME-1 ERB7 TaxID=2759913 RepID=A0A7G9Z5C7_9EURY|nr:putative MFS-type transporter YfcJ [Methanosarcinales archaeon ANME-1 ERB7]
MKAKKNFTTGLMKGVGANVVILGLVSLFTDLSSQMVFPLIPLFLTTALGASAAVVGLVEGAAETTASLLKVFSGYWSDKIARRKPFVLFGYGLSSLMKPLFAVSYIWPSVLVIRIAERVGKGIRTAPRDAIIAESCDTDVRGKAYGIHRAMDGIGSILGAVLGLILLIYLGFRNVFLVAGIPSLIAVLLILFVREEKKAHIAAKSLQVSLKALTPQLKCFIIVATVFTLGHFGYAFLMLRVLDLGLKIDGWFTLGPNPTAMLLYAIFYVIYTIFTIPAGTLSDKIGRKPVIVTGYTLFGLTSLGLVFVSNLFMIIGLFMLYGVFYALIDGVQRAFVVDLASSELKATALGAFHTATGLAALPAGLIAGLLWDMVSPEATFIYGFVLSAIAIALFMRFVKEKD